MPGLRWLKVLSAKWRHLGLLSCFYTIAFVRLDLKRSGGLKKDEMTMRTFDFSPLYRSTVGFDQLQSLLDSVSREADAPTYPPYNIERLGESDYRISMAVAGFSEADLSIEVKQNVLTISGKRTEVEDAKYLHQGIAGRSFERRFQLAEHVEVKGASLANGLLHVDLVRQIPEQLKPRQITITTGKGEARAIQGTLAAAE